MKKNILSLLLIAILFIFTGCNITKVDFEGNDIMKTKELNDIVIDKIYKFEINNISLKTGAIKVKFTEGTVPLVKVTTDENILETISITNKNGVIKISGEKKYRYDISEFTIELTNVSLNKFDIEGAISIKDEIGNYDSSLEVYVKGVIDGDINLVNVVDNLKVTIDGVTHSNFYNLNIKNAEFNINGTASVVASGIVDNLEVDANGLFDITFKELVSKVADVKMDGTCSGSFNVTDEFNLDLNGLGNVDYYGNPKVTNIKKDGLVDVSKK